MLITATKWINRWKRDGEAEILSGQPVTSSKRLLPPHDRLDSPPLVHPGADGGCGHSLKLKANCQGQSEQGEAATSLAGRASSGLPDTSHREAGRHERQPPEHLGRQCKSRPTSSHQCEDSQHAHWPILLWLALFVLVIH
jgi:hypothetical protein